LAKALIIVKADLDDGNVKTLRENQDKLMRSLSDDIQGAISWYGDPRARIEAMSITLGKDSSVPVGLSKATTKALQELSVRDQTRWVLLLMEELDDASAEAFDVLDRVHGSLTRRIWMGVW
jgi:hypothetical protein